MKTIDRRSPAFAVALCLALATMASSAEKAPTPPSTVTVLGKTLALKTKTDSPSEELVAEYIPEKETLDHWTLMLAVRVFKGKIAPDQALAMKTKEVEARWDEGDAMANSVTFAKGDLKVIDFVMSQPPIAEHNVMSF